MSFTSAQSVFAGSAQSTERLLRQQGKTIESTYVVQPGNIVDRRIGRDITDEVNIVALFDIGRVNVDAQFDVGGWQIYVTNTYKLLFVPVKLSSRTKI